jgi:hypothetical protein
LRDAVAQWHADDWVRAMLRDAARLRTARNLHQDVERIRATDALSA